jgi:hypothetical protein
LPRPKHRVDAQRLNVDDVLAEPEERAGAAGAGIDGGRDTRREAHGFRVDRDGIRVPIEVRVRVDEARRHDLPAGVEDLARPIGRNVGRDRGNLAAAIATSS